MGTGISHKLGKKGTFKPPVRIREFKSPANDAPNEAGRGAKAGGSTQISWKLRGPYASVTLTGPDGVADVTQKTRDANGDVTGHWVQVPADVPKDGQITFKLAATAAAGSSAPAPKTLKILVRGAASVLDFGPILASDVSVAGKLFIRWFNEDFYPKAHQEDSRLWPYRAGVNSKYKPVPEGESRYRDVFDKLPPLDEKGHLTLNEFLAYFFIIYEETAGQFVPLREEGVKASNYTEPLADDYFFEPFDFDSGAHKISYNNALGNQKAGDLLKGPKKDLLDFELTDAEVGAWNSTTHYPHHAPHPGTPAAHHWDDVKAAARECDFFKYRGLGLNQITGRGNPNSKGRDGGYAGHVDPFLQAKFGKTSNDMTESELTDAVQDPDVAVPSMNSFYAGEIWKSPAHRRDGSQAGSMTVRELVNADPPEFFWIGKYTNGSDQYGQKLHDRCTAVRDAILATLKAGGADSGPPPDDSTANV